MLRVPSRAARCSCARKVPSLYKRGEIQEPRRGRVSPKRGYTSLANLLVTSNPPWQRRQLQISPILDISCSTSLVG
jgi:hypothetical protein